MRAEGRCPWGSSPLAQQLFAVSLAASCFQGDPQIGDELLVLPRSRLFIGLAQQRRGMNGGDHFRGKLRCEHFASVASHAKGWSEDGLRGGGAETYQQFRSHDAELSLQPWSAGGNLPCVRFLMDAPLA